MLLEKGRLAILPCAGITLIRSAGLISASLLCIAGPAPREPACFLGILETGIEALALHWKSRTAAKVARNTFKML